jgi:hypothetical protein
MESLITQNRLINIIFDYLDWKLNGIEKRQSMFTDFIFVLPDEEYVVMGWENSGALYVFYELMDEIKNMFGLESPDALDVIGRYIEDRYNLKVRHTRKSIIKYRH